MEAATIFKRSDNTAPAVDAAAVVPSDTVDLTTACRSLYIGSTGDVKVITVSGSTVTFVGVLAGTILPVSVSRVFATLTTASSIVALY